MGLDPCGPCDRGPGLDRLVVGDHLHDGLGRLVEVAGGAGEGDLKGLEGLDHLDAGPIFIPPGRWLESGERLGGGWRWVQGEREEGGERGIGFRVRSE